MSKNSKLKVISTSSGCIMRKESAYDSLINEAMYNWGLYQGLLSEYNELLEEKRKLKIGLNAINRKELEQYPDCEFLKIKDCEKAKEYLEDLNPMQLRSLNQEIEKTVKNHVFVTVRARV